MERDDLMAICALADRMHPDYPERPEVLAEKHHLFAPGCFTLEHGATVAGYCFSHPWKTGAPPALDTRLGNLPTEPDSYFIHDLTLDPSMRGRGLAGALMPRLAGIARDNGIARMTLVAVGGSQPFWSHMGFRLTMDDGVQSAARDRYAADSVHMEWLL